MVKEYKLSMTLNKDICEDLDPISDIIGLLKEKYNVKISNIHVETIKEDVKDTNNTWKSAVKDYENG